MKAANGCYLLPHLGWIAARAPNRVNRAHGPTKENRQFLGNFWIFPAHAKNGPRWPQTGPGGFFPTNPDLADILDETDFDFENFYFFDFLGSQIPRFPGSRFPKFQKSGLGPAWARLGPSWGLSAGPGAPAQTLDEISDPNLTPLPTHPGIKYVARTLAATNAIRTLW